MALTQGTIQAVKESKTFNTKYGEKKHVNIKLDDGNWYNVQFEDADKPTRFAQGQSVEFKYTSEENDRGYTNNNVDKKTLEISNAGTNSTSNSSSNSNPGPAKQMSQDAKQDSIMRQSAMGYAAQIVAAKMTGKSSLEQAAQDVVDIAERYFVPFAKGERTEMEAEEENNQGQQSQDTTNGPEDDIPF